MLPLITKTVSNRPLTVDKTQVFGNRKIKLRSRTPTPVTPATPSRRSRGGSRTPSRSPSRARSRRSVTSSPKRKRNDTPSSSETSSDSSDDQDRHPKRRRRNRRTRSATPRSSYSRSASRSRTPAAPPRTTGSRSPSIPRSKALTPQAVAELVGNRKLTRAGAQLTRQRLPEKYQSLFDTAPSQLKVLVGQILRPSFIEEMRQLSPSPGGPRERESQPRQ